MILTELVSGIYEIAENVKNPKPDRRKATRDFNAWVVWPKGKRVRVTEDYDHKGHFTIFMPNGYEHLGVKGRQGGKFNHPGFEALVAALRAVEWTDLEWVRAFIPGQDYVLAYLLKTQKLTREDLAVARESYDREE